MVRKPTVRIFLAVVVLAAASAAATTSGAQPTGRGLEQAIEAQERHTARLLSRPAVAGTAVGVTAGGEATVKVFTVRRNVAGIPKELDGVPVTVEVTGALRALHHRPGHGGGPPGGGGGGGGGSLKPTDRWPRPVPIGISTGNEGECSAGTIGARVRKGSDVFALSNNHVYALENDAPLGSRVLQPGLYDTSCSFSSSNTLGTLADFVSIDFSGGSNTVDAAIALTTTGDLGTSTPPDGYGTPSTTTVSPTLNQAVQKYGRTTSLTRGVVTGINATVRVSYSSGTATFVDQIIVESAGPAFIKAGDSGSLLVTDPGRNPVGLLFAGNTSGKLAVANRIGAVLGAFNVSVDGT
jgi:hypothetical protein